MWFVDYLIDNYVMLFELIGLFIIIIISVHLSERIRLYTRATVILLVLLSFIHCVELYTREEPDLIILRFLLTACKYSLYPVILIVLLPITSPFKGKMKNRYRIAIMAPLLICVPIFFTSQWTRIVNWYVIEGNDSIYHSGPLRFLPYILFGIYLLWFLIFNIVYLSKFSHKNQRISLFISLGSFLGIFLYLIFDRSDDYTPIFTAAVLLYFIFLYINIASIDVLTGLLNRQSYYRALSSNDIYAVISIDMNELKYLNDTFGHDAGDEGLKKISEIFLQFSSTKCRIYRVGGDEFACLIFKEVLDEEVSYIVDKMKEELSKTQYTCAFGYALNPSGDNDNIDEIIKISDTRMYENKNELKRKSLESGNTIHFRED